MGTKFHIIVRGETYGKKFTPHFPSTDDCWTRDILRQYRLLYEKAGKKRFKMSKARPFRILGLLLSTWLCFCAGREMNQQLYGVWRSPHEDYKNTYFEITPEKIEFGNSEQGETQIGTITGVKYKKMKDKIWTQCTVKYKNADSQEYAFEFFFNAPEADTIVFKNQENLIWKKGYDKTGPAFEPEPIDKNSIPGQRTKK